MAAHLHAGRERVLQGAGEEGAGVLHIEHAVLVLGVHLAPARGWLEERRGVTLVGLPGVGLGVLHLQIHPGVFDGLVLVGGRPSGVDGRAVGQEALERAVVAILLDVRRARWRREGGGGEGGPAFAFGAGPGQPQAVLVSKVDVGLEQRAVQVQGAVGHALGVDRPLVGRVGQAVGHLQVAAIALGVIDQAVDASVIGTAEQCRAVDLLVIVAGIAVLEHGAAVAAFLQQVAGILGFHVDAATEATIAGLDRVWAFLHLDVLDQLRLDEDRALLVALEAALGRAIDGHRHVLGVAQAPDVDGLAPGLGRSAHVHPGQGGQDAGDVAWLVTVDLLLVQGRAPDVAGVYLLAIADDAQGAQLDAVVGARVILAQAHHVGAAHAHHAETAAHEQAADGRLGFEVALERRGLGLAEQGLVEQQLDLGLLRQLAQRMGQWLGGQVEGHGSRLGGQAHGQAQGEQGGSGRQAVQRTQRGQHGFPQTAKGRKKARHHAAGEEEDAALRNFLTCE